MKNIVLILFLMLFLRPGFSQAEKESFGIPDLNELTLKKYDKDTSASALVIYDIGKSDFLRNGSGNFDIYFSRTTRIKIFSNAGIKYSEIEIPFYSENTVFEMVSEIKGYTYNIENGIIKKVPLDIKQVYEEKINQGWSQKKFALPDVKEGSVIEYSYRIVSPYKFNLQDWNFQWKIPVKYSEYEVKMIPIFAYTYLLQGREEFDIFEVTEEKGLVEQYGSVKFKRMVYRFGLRDIPAFNDESYITSINDYIIRIDFQLSHIIHPNGVKTDYMSTWNNMCTDILKEDFGRFLNDVENKSLGVTVSLKEDLDKTKKTEEIVKYVRANFKWNNIYDKFPYKTYKEFLEEKTGNSANINLYLTGLLRAAGIEAYPVLISTRGHGKIKSDFPFLHFFNSVVVLVKLDSTQILTDGTEPLAKFDQIPAQCINEGGLVVKKNSNEWVTLVNNRISEEKHIMSLKFSPGLDSINGNFTLIVSDYDAIKMRKNYLFSYEDFVKSLKKNGLEIHDSVMAENTVNIEKPFTVTFKANYPVDIINDKIIIQPFLHEALEENPLKQGKRTYPIDFTYPWAETFNTDIKIPDGYKVVTIPDPVNSNTVNYSFFYQVKIIDNNTINVQARYLLKNAVYEPQFHGLLKVFFNNVIKKVNEPVVLEKIQNL